MSPPLLEIKRMELTTFDDVGDSLTRRSLLLERMEKEARRQGKEEDTRKGRGDKERKSHEISVGSVCKCVGGKHTG